MILGITGSGKTTLARDIAATAKMKKRRVVVFDPFLHSEGNTWSCDFITADLDRFCAVVFNPKNQGLVVMIDEAGTALDRDADYNRLATLSRHSKHDVYFIAQQPTMLLPVIRCNCDQAFIFRVGGTFPKLLAAELAAPEIERAATLEKYHYLWWRDFSKISEHKIILSTRACRKN